MTSPISSAPSHAPDVWPLVHTERAALAGDLDGLSDGGWATTSLCSEFTVREVLAHMTSAATLSFPRWLTGVIPCRFDFDKNVPCAWPRSWVTHRPRPSSDSAPA